MKRRTWIAIGIACAAILAAATIVFASRNDDLARVRRSTAGFQRPEVAQAAGWDLVPGLDHCFDNPGVGAMGYHYINTALLDTELDPLRPEAMVYELRPNGQLKLGAVEYIVPAADWDAISSELPALHGQSFHLNEDLGVYVLHAWIWKHNPAGMFEDWNPRVSC
ncbi:MAG: hypothetical protein ACK2UK_11310 [Candidatus Promineifilaceae bacterium]